jgi:nitroimidazol reductase NimA-like FMN-containing flavoprotein (pyridoxamine 5'-phosphate oxidase superfamily)
MKDKKETAMISVAKSMIADNNFCVLSTCGDGQPNSSLMQYTCDDGCTKLFMLTLQGSRKQQNIEKNPRVSLLIDTRADLKRNQEPVKSLTVYGRAEFIQAAPRKNELISQLVQKNNDLQVLAGDSNCLVIQVSAEKLLLLDGVDKSTYMDA